MATYSATCANNSPAQGINMANSIANLRLKAKEYSLQRNQVPTVNWGKKYLNRPKKKSKTIRHLSCSVISSSAGKKNKNKQTNQKTELSYWDHGREKQERSKMKIS